MKARIIFALLAGTLALATPAHAITELLNPDKDGTLYEPIAQDSFADRASGIGDEMFTGKVKDADADPTAGVRIAVRRGVLSFDFSSIPAGATINSVTLTMTRINGKSNTGYPTSLHRLTSDWGEGASDAGNSQAGRGDTPAAGDATWDHTFYSGSFWTTPGGDHDPNASATTSVGGNGDYIWGTTAALVADVQAWVDGTQPNYGWVVIGDESQIETTKVFATRENTANGGNDVPLLTVDYTASVISGGCCQGTTCTIETPAQCTVLGGVYQGDGAGCSPNPCIDPNGACCASSGTCTDVTESTCTSGGGTWQGGTSSCSTFTCPVNLTPFIDPLFIPPVALPTSGSPGATATYDMTAREFTQQVHSELPNPTTMWGWDDGTAGPSSPGPTIVAGENQPVTVNWINDLRELSGGALRTDHFLQQSADDLACTHGAQDAPKIVVHLHGGHVPADVDGYPEDTFLPGFQDQYVYPNGQQAGFLWYHDHALGITRLNVYMGMAGGYLVRDPVESALNIPGGIYEVPLILQDRQFNPDGSLYYPPTWQDHFFGDKAMINGVVWPYLDVDQGKYRLKLLGGAGSRVFTLSLNGPSGTVPFTAIGTEGGLLQAPVPGLTQLTISPGERYEIVVDFATFNPGDEIFLENSAPAPYPGGTVDLTQIMKFNVTSNPGDTDPLPATLRTVTPIPEGEAVMTRDFELKKTGVDACGRSFWEINGLHWDDITEYPELDTVEIWRFINDSGVSHPMHMHLVFFQILDRDTFTVDPNGQIVPDGNPQPPLPEESGWKDTALVNPGEILRVIARFEDYKGKYAYHCHILEHEDHEMMRQFQTVKCGDAEVDVTEICDDGNGSAFDGCSDTCEPEEYFAMSGVTTGAGGGRIDLIINGELVRENLSTGLTAEQVAQQMAAAINANVNLQALGITATAVGGTVVTNGDITSVDVRDNGLVSLVELRHEQNQLWWGHVEGASSGYDIVSGSLDQLKATVGDFADATVTTACLANDSAETILAGLPDPPPGSGVWYLMRTQPGGSYDTGLEAASRDAPIASSGNDCP